MILLLLVIPLLLAVLFFFIIVDSQCESNDRDHMSIGSIINTTYSSNNGTGKDGFLIVGVPPYRL
jgi:hypothetical protein